MLIYGTKDNEFRKLDTFQLKETNDLLETGITMKERIRDGVILTVYIRDDYNNYDVRGNHSPYSLKFNLGGKDIGYIKVPTPQENYNKSAEFENKSNSANDKDAKLSIAYCKYHHQAICDFIDFKSDRMNSDQEIQMKIIEFIQKNTEKLKNPDVDKLSKAASNTKYIDQYYNSGNIRNDFEFIKTLIERRRSLNHPDILPINPANKYLKMFVNDHIDLEKAIEYMSYR